MNNLICSNVVSQYIDHIRSDFKILALDENRCLVVTPFLYPDFASIELGIEIIGESYLITDYNETLNMLFVNGLAIESNKEMYEQAQKLAIIHGVLLDENGISVVSNENELGEQTQKMLNAIQAIGQMLHKRRTIRYTTFDEEVEKLMISNDIDYDVNFSIQGKANSHKVKFHLNSNKNLLIEPISALTTQSARNKAKGVAYMWLDLRLINPHLKYITVVDDRDDKWETIWLDDEARNAIEQHSDEVIRWEQQKDEFLEILDYGMSSNQ